MIVFLIMFVLVCLYQVQVKPKPGDKFITDYMSMDKTNAVKGIFIVLVFISHFDGYARFVHPWDISFNETFSLIGQRMVTMFLFYSGYGVMESIRKKGQAYVNKIPLTRVLGTYFRFDIALIFFIAIKYMIDIHTRLGLKHFLLSLIAWDSIGNSNWYIFVIVVCYLFTFIAFEICRDKWNYKLSILLVTIFTVAYVLIMLHFAVEYRDGVINKHGSRWYNTIICYPLGMIFSNARGSIEKFVNKHFLIWLVFFASAVALERLTYYHYKDYEDPYTRFWIYSAAIIIFVAAIVLFTMRVSLNNFILRFLGKHLFGIYIMMRIPMIFFKEIINISNHTYIYFTVCAVCTIPLAYMLDTYTGKAWKYLTSGKKRKEA